MFVFCLEFCHCQKPSEFLKVLEDRILSVRIRHKYARINTWCNVRKHFWTVMCSFWNDFVVIVSEEQSVRNAVWMCDEKGNQPVINLLYQSTGVLPGLVLTWSNVCGLVAVYQSTGVLPGLDLTWSNVCGRCCSAGRKKSWRMYWDNRH